MESRRTRGRRARGATALAMAAVGALGGIALARRRRAATADEPLEAGRLPEVLQATGAQELPAELGADELRPLRAPDAEGGEGHVRQPAPARATS